MKVLIIGGGGREHALAWKVAQSKLVESIYVAPGNAGTSITEKCQNVDIKATDLDALLDFACQASINLTIVGPEAPLAAGIADLFSEKGLACFGPSQAAARLEASKAFAKEFMLANQIPTAQHATFTDLQAALDYLKSQSYPLVIKADGLAAGKGVLVVSTAQQAQAAVTDMLTGNRFGDAGAVCVIEEFIEGEELSFMAMVDGLHILPFASSQDHKRLLDADLGPNTGGMGAYSPAPICDAALQERIIEQVMRPVVDAMQRAGTPYKGFLYAGLMVMPDGQFKVLEFNCRLGDPETQVLIMRLKSDLVQLILAAEKGELHQADCQWDARSALTVVMTAGGYPLAYQKGMVIEGLDSVDESVLVFHAGTKQAENQVLTNGGRVLCVSALGASLQLAHDQVYCCIDQVSWPQCFYRRDIGYRALST